MAGELDWQSDFGMAHAAPAAAVVVASSLFLQSFAPAGNIRSITAQGWPAQPPDLFVKPFPAVQQQFPAFQPEGRIFSTTPQGWPYEPPPAFKTPLRTCSIPEIT